MGRTTCTEPHGASTRVTFTLSLIKISVWKNIIKLLVQSSWWWTFSFSKHAEDNKKRNGKAVPLEAWSGPEGSRKLRFPDFMTTAQEVVKADNLTTFLCRCQRPASPPGYPSSWYSFLLEAESTPGPYCEREDYVNEKFQWHHLGSKQRPSDL